MSIGVGIFLIAAGAILAFAVRDPDGAVDLNVVGVVVMLAGAAGIWLSYRITNQRRRVPTDAIDPAVEEQYRTVEEAHDAEVKHRIEPLHRPAHPTTQQPTQPTTQPARQPVQQPVQPQSQVPPPAAGGTAVPQPVDGVPGEQPVSTERHVDLDPRASGLPEQPTRRRR